MQSRDRLLVVDGDVMDIDLVTMQLAAMLAGYYIKRKAGRYSSAAYLSWIVQRCPTATSDVNSENRGKLSC